MGCKYRFIWYLLGFVTMTLGITSSTSSSEHTKCLYPMPNYNQQSGVDITKFNMRSADHYTDGLLNISCNSNLTWSNPHYPNQTFALPDQFARFTLNESNQLHSPQILFAHDMIDMQNILLSMSTPQENLIGACSQDKDYKNYLREYFHQNKSHVALMSSQINVYSFVLKPPNELMLSDRFENRIKNLPVKYEQNQTAYREFVANFGTHYLERANFSGIIFWKFPISNDYFRSSSEKEIENNLRAAFFMWTGQKNVKLPKSYKEFCKNVDMCDLSSHVKLGGTLRSGDSIDGWFLGGPLVNVYRFPWAIEYFLRPLEDLIADENLRAQVKIASEMYRIEAYLGELMEVCDTAQKYYQPSVEDQALLYKVKTFVYSNNSTINSVEAIQIIDDLYNKVKDKPDLDQLLADYHVTAALKLQFANSICDRSAGLCPSNATLTENDQFEKLYHEYESRKADAKYFTREKYHQFRRKVQKISSSFHMYDDLHRGLGASCKKC